MRFGMVTAFVALLLPGEKNMFDCNDTTYEPFECKLAHSKLNNM
jgi:hypothetical protein